ncbi:tyrosine-type recombinase/integrase [Arthrobacter sp. NicSoilB8]|uniref:tyrosine-type recombinase/integrase n=1 Tax=Arthrobacter sp. NicSoilB8 TaxID=2830998 RepID=UPI00320A21AC
MKRSGIPRITPHDLRHSAASFAVSAGANVKAVQKMLGHGSAAMTLDVYAVLFDDDLDSVADALDNAVSRSDVVKMLPWRVIYTKQKALLPFIYKGSRAFLIRGDGGI